MRPQSSPRRARRREDQDEARRREEETLRQLNLLRQMSTNQEGSDFYPYRYLASEGFLPGAPVAGADEVGTLATTFNKMLGSIAVRDQHIAVSGNS